jgi:MCP family monocarboxylic acid transporter-like MFS transporter 5
MGYRVYTVGGTLMILGFTLPHTFLVPYAMWHGVDEYRAALLVSIIGFCNIFLRPIAGLLIGRQRLAGYRKYLFSLAVLLNGLTNLVCTVSADYQVLVGYCLVYSVSMCGVGVLIFQVLMDIVPMDRFPSALGLFTVLCGIASLISPPLAGENLGGKVTSCAQVGGLCGWWAGYGGVGQRLSVWTELDLVQHLLSV